MIRQTKLSLKAYSDFFRISVPCIKSIIFCCLGDGRDGRHNNNSSDFGCCLVRLNSGDIATDLLRAVREGSSSASTGDERKQRRDRRRRGDRESSSSSAATDKENRGSKPAPVPAAAVTAAESKKSGKFFLVGDYPAINSKVR